MRSIHKTFALLMAALMCFAVLPVGVLAKALPVQQSRTVPAGYDEHDYNAIINFLEQTDENGVKNGVKLSRYDYYDPTDPTSWWGFDWIVADGVKRICSIRIEEAYDLVGTLDVSQCQNLARLACQYNSLTGLNVSNCPELDLLNCSYNSLTELHVSQCPKLTYFGCAYNSLTELDVSQCPELDFFICSNNSLTELDVSQCPKLANFACSYNNLTELDVSQCAELYISVCSYNRLTELDVSQCPKLNYLDCSVNALTKLNVSQCAELYTLVCSDNSLTELDVSQCPKLGELGCSNNSLTVLDVSQCTELSYLDCRSNYLTELDLPNNIIIPVERICSVGNGFIGLNTYYDSDHSYKCSANAEGSSFIGWFSETGELLSTESELDISSVGETVLTARFGGSVIGDADGNGTVNANDALMVLRYALGLIGYVDPAAADVDGNGTVNANDALMILRAALGIATL